MNPKSLIKKAINQALEKDKLTLKEEIQVERIKALEFGDYATNLAFLLSDKLGLTPGEIAQRLKKRIEAFDQKKNFKKIEVAGGGFLNFFLAKSYLQKSISQILEKKEIFGRTKLGKELKVQVEFVSANPTGKLHLGTGRNAFFGDVLANVLSWTGFDVQREYYINDAKQSTQIRELGKTALGKGAQYQTDYIKKKANKLKDKLKGVKDEGEAGYLLAQEIVKDIKKLMEELNVKFDNWFHEEDLYKGSLSKKFLTDLKKQGLVYEKEGALWLKTSEFGDDKDRVLIRQNGQPTYFFSDILYHQNKIERGFKKIINVWGADHQGHVSRMQAMMKILDFKGSLDIPIIQMVRLKTSRGPQKMSKRLGTAIELEWLIKQVGKDVARFFMLSRSINAQMIFNLELAKERSEKNPVYYVQYALVRAKSILKKAKDNQELKPKVLELLEKKPELDLMKELIRFPEKLEEVAKSYEVHQLIFYAIGLAKKFHQFYKKISVLGAENENLQKARLLLVLATKTVLENLLKVLGISRPEKM